ncbi:MAG: AbrB/MazE/SpoVT family DNA-binding domain-containing protein [Proteobacteria bacterium]|nr:AbrB/MazE/SpoVT family DNA-binding domain-containing protein [Pseudomonadota bacterium]MBI3498308.1 AbrB/MazE/SpoVT family DNA-binding domain-containing protein [Pseudomonadota bacterium]
MAETGTAKLFKYGRSQAVRLPKSFRLPGKEVRVRRVGRGVLLEPVERDLRDIEAVFAEIDRLGGADFLTERRPGQPSIPPARPVFEE